MRLRKKLVMIRLLRGLTLLGVVTIFVFIPLNHRYANLKVAYNQTRLVELAEGYWMARVYGGLDWLYGARENPVDAATANNGSLWAFTLFGLPFSDPLGVLSELTHAVRFPRGYVIGAIFPLLLALVLGRVFCAWLCPTTLLFAISAQVRKVFLLFRIPLLDLKLEPQTRIFIFWIGMLTSFFSGAWVWHFVLPYIAISHELFAGIAFSATTVGAYFVLAVFVLDIGLIPGQFCRSICPSGWFLSKLGAVPLLKLRAKSEACPKGCTRCRQVCPVDLFPKKDQLFSCHLCLECVASCPKQHIQLGLNPAFPFLGQGRAKAQVPVTRLS